MHISRAFDASELVSALMEFRAIEKEVRIHLSFQGAEFGIASQHAGFHHARFRLTRSFDRNNHVIQSDPEKIQQQARDDYQRNFRAEAVAESRESIAFSVSVLARLSAATAQMIAGEERGSEMSGYQASESIFFQRISAAGIPRSKGTETHITSKAAGQNDRFMIVNLVGDGEEIGQQPCNGNPCEEVNDEAAELAEYGMHGRELILYDNATDQAGALHDQLFCVPATVRRLLIGFVNERAEQADALHGNLPLVWNFDFAAAHEGHRLDRGGIAFHVRLAQINLKSPHDGQNAATFEFLARDAALESAKNCDTVKIGIRGTDA